MENEAPVSSQNFLSDLRQINEALRQFDSPGAQPMSLGHTGIPAAHSAPVIIPPASATQPTAVPNSAPAPQVTAHTGSIGMALNGRTQSILMEVREKLNLSSEAEAMQMLVAIGYKQLKPLID